MAVRDLLTNLIVRDVIARELADGFCRRREQFAVRVHLLDGCVDDRLEDPVDETAYELGKVHGLHQVAELLDALAHRARLERLAHLSRRFREPAFQLVDGRQRFRQALHAGEAFGADGKRRVEPSRILREEGADLEHVLSERLLFRRIHVLPRRALAQNLLYL
jgi:hypothetical protein